MCPNHGVAPMLQRILGAACAAALLTAPMEAAADGGVRAHLDLSYDVALGEVPDDGFNMNLLVGYQLNIAILKLMPEIGTGLYYDSTALVPRAGVRAWIGSLVQPGAYVHLLYHLPQSAAGVDGGLTLDVSIPRLRFGAHVGAQTVFRTGVAFQPGLHASVKF